MNNIYFVSTLVSDHIIEKLNPELDIQSKESRFVSFFIELTEPEKWMDLFET